MTKFVLSYASVPLDYPTLGFLATANGAILDGTLFDPDLTVPPDAKWSVYGGGSAETNITRYATPSEEFLDPTPEITAGWVLAYDTDANTFVPTAATSLSFAWTASTVVTTDQVRQAPDGSWIKSLGNRTTRPSFDATEQGFWVAVLADEGTVEATALSAAIERGAGSRALSEFGTVDVTGAANSDTAFAAALAWAQSEGGTIQLPQGIIRVDSQIVFTNDGDTFSPRQRNVRITGVGHAWNGMFLDPIAGQGTWLDLRYTGGGTGQPKIDTRGTGILEIDHLAITDLGTSSNPFLATTQTTLMLHDMSFLGNAAKEHDTCDQDAIRMGGTAAVYNNTVNSGFAGYGSIIERVWFHRIRRAVHARCWVNNIVFRDNTVTNKCGSADAHGAPFELDSTHTGTLGFSNGNLFEGNTVEVTGYKHGFSLIGPYTTANWLVGNGCWDSEPAEYLSDYYFGTDVGGNVVLAASGHADRFIEEEPGSNRLLDFTGLMQGGWIFQGPDGTQTVPLTIKRAGTQPVNMFEAQNAAGGVQWRITPSGSLRNSTNMGDEYPIKVDNDSWAVPSAHFVNAKGFGVLLGSPVLQAALEFTNGSGTTITGEFAGTGSPEGVKTAPVGSTYRRTDGGAGTTFYVKESGTGNTGWVAK